MNIINIEHIAKIYQVGFEEVHALRDVSLRIDKNEYVAIMGPSGSGKSTLMNMLGSRPNTTSRRIPPARKDATMIITVTDPLSEPMIHKDFPGGPVELQEYVMEVCDGIKDHLVRDPRDPHDTRWEYTYHQRLFGYTVPTLAPIDQIETLARKLAKTPHTRRAQAITWKVWEDNDCYDPACLQSVWCRLLEEDGQPVLSMNVRFRSNDAYKAAFMNIFALVQLQQRIAARIGELSGRPVRVGRYCHMADSYHIYGSNAREFEGRFTIKHISEAQ